MYSISDNMRKFLGKPPTDPTSDGSASGVGNASAPTAVHFRPSASQDAVYLAKSPISCIDRSPDRQCAILAGPHVLKTIRLDGLDIKEGFDLRALVIAQHDRNAKSNPLAPSSSSVADQLSIQDVKWAMGLSNNSTVFTACASGKIFQYDLARLGSSLGTALGEGGLDFIQIREDSRQVNALDINPHRPTFLISGSQDGLVRCFDIRGPVQAPPPRAGSNGLTFRCLQSFKCNADGVRQVRWSPRDAFYFACSTDQGVVLKWDIRKPGAPVLRIKAHEKICSAIAWHSDGAHLISAGWDSRCNVWDVSETADRRQKPKYTFTTSAPVSALAWRPGQWSATAHGRRTSQIAVSYENSQKKSGIKSLQVWDLARPTMPYTEIQRFEYSPSALLWRDQDLLWTAGQDGLFAQCDVRFAPKVIDRQAVSTMAFSSQGDVLMFLDERPPSLRARPHTIHAQANTAHNILSTPSGHKTSPPAAGIPNPDRDDSDDEFMGTFAGLRRRRGSRSRPPPAPPPNGAGIRILKSTSSAMIQGRLLSLEQTLKATGTYRPRQTMTIGHVPAAARADVYAYLAGTYLETLSRELPNEPGRKALPDRIATILEHYAKTAESVQLYRLAQTWRILAFGMDLLLRKRAQYHLEERTNRTGNPSASSKNKADNDGGTKLKPMEVLLEAPGEAEELLPRARLDASPEKPHMPSQRSLLAEELESTSNIPTPIARPVRDGSAEAGRVDGDEFHFGKKLTPVLGPDSFTLPPAIQASPESQGQGRLDPVPRSSNRHADPESDAGPASIEGYDFYDADHLAQAIDAHTSGSKSEVQAMPIHQNISSSAVARRDSTESYGQVFSTYSESRQAARLVATSEGSPRRVARNRDRRDPSSGSGSGSGSDDTGLESEYQGRRGRHRPANAARPQMGRPSMIERSETGNLTSYTDEHHLITQTTTDSLGSRGDDDVPSQSGYDEESPRPLSLPWRGRGAFSSSADARDEDRRLNVPYIIETDYLYRQDDPPYPYTTDNIDETSSSSKPVSTSPPLDPYSLLARALAFEVRTSALNASAMILLLKPLVPDGFIDNHQAAAILRQHHSRLMGMRLFVEATLLRKLCVRGWPGGDLANWGTNYPLVYKPAQRGVQVAFLCPYPSCGRAREGANPALLVDGASAIYVSPFWYCEHCRATMPGCAVCGHRDAPPMDEDVATMLFRRLKGEAAQQHEQPHNDQSSAVTTWWYCPGCGHGGHSTCMQGWHGSGSAAASAAAASAATGFSEAPDGLPISSSLSDGCCPLDGCGHACLPGRWRSETAAARSEEVSREMREAPARMTVQAAASRLGRGSYGKGDGGAAAARGAGISTLGGGSSSNPVTPTAMQSTTSSLLGGISGMGSASMLANMAIVAPGATSYAAGSMLPSTSLGGAALPAERVDVVSSDDVEVPPSKAVDGVREVLTGGENAGAYSGSGGGCLTAGSHDSLGTSLGRRGSFLSGPSGDARGGAGPEKRKSVKFAEGAVTAK